MTALERLATIIEVASGPYVKITSLGGGPLGITAHVALDKVVNELLAAAVTICVAKAAGSGEPDPGARGAEYARLLLDNCTRHMPVELADGALDLVKNATRAACEAVVAAGGRE